MKTLRIIIGRMNPPTRGHIELIDTALNNNHEVLVLLWWNEKTDTKNPLDYKTRKKLLQKYYQDEKHIIIKKILDVPSDKKWIQNIIDIIQDIGTYKRIIFHGGNPKDDSALQVIKQYRDIFPIPVCFDILPREFVCIRHEWQKIPISSTLLRKAIHDWNTKLIEKLTPKWVSISL